MEPTTLAHDWYLAFVGTPWWVVIPLAVLAVWSIRRLAVAELVSLSTRSRRGLLFLRGGIVGFLVLLLVEPTFSVRQVREELPEVAVLLDASASMAVRDPGMNPSVKLAEAVALGLIEPALRDTTLQDTARAIRRLIADIPMLLRALSKTSTKVEGQEGVAALRQQAIARALHHQTTLTPLLPRLAGREKITQLLVKLRQALAHCLAIWEKEPSAPAAKNVIQAFKQVQQKSALVMRHCRLAQRARDGALIASAMPDSPIAMGIRKLNTFTRFERIRRLATTRLQPLFAGKATAKYFAMGRELIPLDGTKESASGAPGVAGVDEILLRGATDFSTPLLAFAQDSSAHDVSAVILLSDGRQTTGEDPAPAVKALRDRGIPFAAIAVGDLAAPRDAVVAEIKGPQEIFRCETLRLGVRFRIQGYPQMQWNLILTGAGKEIARRTVIGNAQWQAEKFEIPASKAGLIRLQAKLTPFAGAGGAEPDCRALWDFAAAVGGRLLDRSGKGHNGILKPIGTKLPLVPGRGGQAVQFTRGKQKIHLQQPVKIKHTWTATAWIKNSSSQHNLPKLQALISSADNTALLALNAKYEFGMLLNGAFHPAGMSLKPASLGWHFLTVVTTKTETQFYLDGRAVGGSRSRIANTSVRTLLNVPNGKAACQVAVDDIAIYKRAFSVTDILAAMHRRIRAGGQPGLSRTVWSNIKGERVQDLRQAKTFQNGEGDVGVVVDFEAPRNNGDHFGSRLRGFIIPPKTGRYQFLLSADDAAELWLSASASVAKRRLLAEVKTASSFRETKIKNASQSNPIYLKSGERYYVEVLHKEGTGADHVSVGWKQPGGKTVMPIPGKHLRVFSRLEEIPVNPLQEATLDNNQADHIVAVNEDPLRVLLIDAHPRWESRYLMTMFERDRRVRLTRRFRSIRLPRGEFELLPATQKELNRFDLVVFGDVRPTELAVGDQKRLVNFVVQRGGFLIFLAGPRAMPSAYSLGGLSTVLPVRVSVAPPVSRVPGVSNAVALPTTVRLARQGMDHPLTAILRNPGLNRKLWPALPGLTWIVRNVKAKSIAQVLLESESPERTPLLVLGRSGAGRTLYLGTDETWRWRDRLGDRVHQTFWLQAVRWGLGLRLRGEDARLKCSISQSLLAPGQSVLCRARAAETDGTPITATINVHAVRLDAGGKPLSDGERSLAMLPMRDNPFIQRVQLAGLTEGRWRITFRSEHPALRDLTEVRELVVRYQVGQEGLDLSVDLAALERLASLGGQRAGTFGEGEEVLQELLETLTPRVRQRMNTWSLWDNYLVLILAVGWLLVEWIWRKRVGLP